MTKNKLSDLNNHLFAQLERLSDEELKLEELEKEINRSKAINSIAKNIIDNAKVCLDGAEFAYKFQTKDDQVPEQFIQKKLNKEDQS